jgi:capsular exopolysaccharide synthesis family protein
MLDRHLRGVPTKPSPEPATGNGEIGLPHIIAFFRRQRFPIVLAPVVILLLGIVYLATATPQYTAVTSLLIDNRKLAIFGDGDVFGEEVISNANVESQVQIFLSGRIAGMVAKKLDLIHDPDFMDGSASLAGVIVGQVASLFRPAAPAAPTTAPPPDESLLIARAAALLRSNLAVARAGLSYVINVSYTAEDPVKAAEIVNAFTAAYVEDQFNAQVAIAQRGSDWLLARIRDLNERGTDESLTAQEKSAIRATYDVFLQRYTEMVQQQSLPSTEARVITPAIQGARTSPKTMLVIAGSLIFGVALGFGIGLTRDLLDRAVRTGAQVEAVTGTAFLGYLPAFNLGGFAMRRIAKRSKKKLDPEARRFAAGPAYSMVLTAPFSRFTETLRNIKLAADEATPAPAIVLGVTSSLPNEGKTTVAINLARLVAQSGGRALLIDGDLRNRGLSRDLVPPEAPGLVQLIEGEAQIGEVMWSDQATRLQFLPAGAEAKGGNANEVLGSAGMQALLEACRRQYNVVIVDLPAVLPVVDTRAAAHLFDGFIFVVEWGYTTEEVLAQAFHVGGIADKVIGAVLNKVNLGALRRYQDRPTELIADKYLESYRHTA